MLVNSETNEGINMCAGTNDIDIIASCITEDPDIFSEEASIPNMPTNYSQEEQIEDMKIDRMSGREKQLEIQLREKNKREDERKKRLKPRIDAMNKMVDEISGNNDQERKGIQGIDRAIDDISKQI